MKLTYKILWLDDNMNELFIEDEYDKEIEEYLAEQGFNHIIDTVSTEDEFFEKLDSSYDLIMTDYHLKEKDGKKRDGDLIVKEVRDRSIFTEILFYSARGDVKDTYKLDRISFVETSKMTDSHQEALMKSTIGLIDLTIKKFQHIVAMRGMIMHETSSLDVLIEELLTELLNNGDSKAIIKVIKEKYLKTMNDFSEKIEKSGDTSEILYSIGADHRLRAVLRNIGKSDIKTILNDYTKEVITVRNQFAHAVLDESTNTFKTKNGLVFNDEECKKIRTNINKHLKNLESLKEELSKA